MHRINRIKELISVLCLAAIVCSILFNVIGRAVFNLPIAWSVELTSILIIWAVYLMLGVNYENDRHFAIELLKDNLPEKYKAVLDVAIDVVLLCVLGFIIYYDIVAFKTNIYMTTGYLNLSVSIAFRLPLLIGCISTLFYMIMKYILKYKKGVKP